MSDRQAGSRLGYNLLRLHDISTPSHTRYQFCFTNLKHNASVYLIVLLSLTCTGLFIALFNQPPYRSWASDNSEVHVRRRPCGTTPAEARARGCHFDVMSFSWLPDACWDAALSAEFDDEKPWKWWRYDEHGTLETISHEFVMTGEFTDVYVDQEYHVHHCIAMWKKLHRALLRGGQGAIDEYIGSYNHTLHCEEMLLEGEEPGMSLSVVNSVIRLKFPDCGVLRW